MLTIGEFSKICKVSTKALRYYDEIGLIKPVEINLKSGYRYYSVEQLKKVIFINRLKSYDFSLEEIKKILNYEKDEYEERLEQALIKKKEEMLFKLNSINSSLKQIECDIKNIKEGEDILCYINKAEVKLYESSNTNIISIRKMLKKEECEKAYGECFDILHKKIVNEKLTVLGAPAIRYHSSEYSAEGYDVEFVIPVKEAVKGTKELKGCLCAMSVLQGSYSNLPEIYTRIMEWIEREGYKVNGAPYEAYITNPFKVASEDELITEVYFPIKSK